MYFYILLLLVVFLINFYLFVFIFSAPDKTKASNNYLLYVFSIGAWELFELISWLPGVSGIIIFFCIKLQILAWLSCSFLFLNFVFEFIKKEYNLVFKLLLFFTLIFFLIGLNTNLIIESYEKKPWGIRSITGILYFPAIITAGIMPGLYAIFLIFHSWIKTTNEILKKQLLLLLLGASLTFTFTLCYSVITQVFYTLRSLPGIQSSLAVIQSIFIFIAIKRYNFLSISVQKAAYEIFSQIEDSIILIDKNKKIIELNNTAMHLVNQNKNDLIDINNNIFPENYSFDKNYKNEQIAVLNTNTKHKKYYLFSQTSLHQSGIMIGKLIILKDITRQKTIEEENMNIKNIESLGILASGMAHDFNNLLTAILGNISIAKMMVDDDIDLYNLLSDAEMASLKSKKLTQNLLTFSRGGTPVKKIESITKIVKEVVTTELSSSKIKYFLYFEDNINKAEFDKIQIRQALSNIVINAREAMQKGGILNIEAKNYYLSTDSYIPLPAGDYLQITIKDNGIGIPEKNLTKIYDLYFTTKAFKHGLGLSSVFSIIKRHNGYIEASSTQGEGTIFTIYIPSLPDE